MNYGDHNDITAIDNPCDSLAKMEYSEVYLLNDKG